MSPIGLPGGTVFRETAIHRRFPRGAQGAAGDLLDRHGVMILHVLEILLWAIAYFWLVPSPRLGTVEEANCFSFATFTTLGLCNVTPARHRR